MASILDANVTGLKADLANWLHRSDFTSTDLGGFIWLAETKFNTEMRNREMIAQIGAVSITAPGYISHPTDWQAWKSLSLVVGTQKFPLNPLSTEAADLIYGGSYNGQPKGYVVNGDRTYIAPGPGSGSYSYEGWYYQGLPALGQNQVTSNWLLLQNPYMYLYGALLEATAFVGDDPRVGLWKAAVDEGLTKLEEASRNARYSGALLQSRPDRVC